MAQRALESVESGEQFLADLYEWHSAESDTVVKCFEIQKKTNDILVNLVAEIIQRNSKTHIQVLSLLHEESTKKAISPTPDELGRIWDLVESYEETERKSKDMAEKVICSDRIFAIKQLFVYMVEDESRNLTFLNQLKDFGRRLDPH